MSAQQPRRAPYGQLASQPRVTPVALVSTLLEFSHSTCPATSRNDEVEVTVPLVSKENERAGELTVIEST